MAGRFISFEGIDGAGKTTHVAALAQHLQQAGQHVVTTREPGGTALAEQLRSALLQLPMDALTESLLVFAARRDHLRAVIEPALSQGNTVLCDRFSDATFAYQGAGRGFDLQVLATLEQWVHPALQPDLTLWFDIDPAAAAIRRAAARQPDRFEQQDTAFFTRVRAGYQTRMAAAPARFVRIDSTQPREAVWLAVLAALQARGWLL